MYLTKPNLRQRHLLKTMRNRNAMPNNPTANVAAWNSAGTHQFLVRLHVQVQVQLQLQLHITYPEGDSYIHNLYY
jgi:hypothetical protein